MAHDFRSDNTAAASPAILAAIAAANHGPAGAYGDDAWTARLDGVAVTAVPAPPGAMVTLVLSTPASGDVQVLVPVVPVAGDYSTLARSRLTWTSRVLVSPT